MNLPQPDARRRPPGADPEPETCNKGSCLVPHRRKGSAGNCLRPPANAVRPGDHWRRGERVAGRNERERRTIEGHAGCTTRSVFRQTVPHSGRVTQPVALHNSHRGGLVRRSGYNRDDDRSCCLFETLASQIAHPQRQPAGRWIVLPGSPRVERPLAANSQSGLLQKQLSGGKRVHS